MERYNGAALTVPNIVLRQWSPLATKSGAHGVGHTYYERHRPSARGQPLKLCREPGTMGYPRASTNSLATHVVTRNLLNHCYKGDRLVARLYPRYGAYIAGRADQFNDWVVEDYLALTRLTSGWSGLLARHSVALTVSGRTSPLASVLGADSTWSAVAAVNVDVRFSRHSGGAAPRHAAATPHVP